MKSIQPYVFFDGNCREAMSFYAQALGGRLQLTPASDVPGAPSAQGERIMHAHLDVAGSVIMASDWMASEPYPEGRSFSLSIDCQSLDEQTRLFSALSQGGTVTMPLQDTFWGAHFGMLKDQFGIRWMFNLQKPHQS